MSPDETRSFIVDHFDALINKGDMSAIARNVAENYVDHDGPGGNRIDLKQASNRTSSNLKKYPDLRVDIRDVVVEGDKVVVRNVWTGTDPETGHRLEMHGFVLFRIENGKLAERWATVTAPTPLHDETFDW